MGHQVKTAAGHSTVENLKNLYLNGNIRETRRVHCLTFLYHVSRKEIDAVIWKCCLLPKGLGYDSRVQFDDYFNFFQRQMKKKYRMQLPHTSCPKNMGSHNFPEDWGLGSPNQVA
jgi:hypothetical protein